MATYTLDGRVGQLLVRGRELHADVAEAVLGGSVELSTQAATQLSITLSDPDLSLLASCLFDRGAACDYADLKLAVAAVETRSDASGPVLEVSARSLGWRRLKQAKGALVRRNLSPTEFAALEAKAAGLRFVGEASARRRQIARQTGDQAETSWDTIQRLAQEIGFIAFEAAGILYFGRPTWLVSRSGARRWSVTWSPDPAQVSPGLVGVPECRRSEDDASAAAEVTVDLVAEDADQIRPGDVLALAGVPTFSASYLVTSVRIPLDDTRPVVVSAQTPVNPAPQPPASSSSGGSTSSGSSSQVEKFVAAAIRQAGDRYVYGAEARLSDPDPDAFDCSELVQWAAYQAGVRIPDGSAAQLEYCRRKGTLISVATAARTRGALLFKPGHVAISLGDGRHTIEAMGRRYGVRRGDVAGRGWTHGAKVPGMRYPK